MAKARALAADSRAAAKDPGAAVDLIRTLPAREQLAFAHAMLVDSSIPANDRAYMLFMLGASGPGDKSAGVSFDEIARTANPETLASLERLLTETGKNWNEDLAKKPVEEQKKLAEYASDSVPLLAMLLPHLGKEALAHIVAKADTPEARETLGKALALTPPEFLGKLASKLDAKGLETAVNALVDTQGLDSLRDRALGDLLGGMKPKQRNAVFDKLETSSRWETFLDAVRNPQVLERILPSLSPGNLAALNQGFERAAAGAAGQPGSAEKAEGYRDAADLVERYARNKAEHDPSFGKKYDRARDAYSDRDGQSESASGSAKKGHGAGKAKVEPAKNPDNRTKVEGTWKLGNKAWYDDWIEPR